MKLFLFFIIGAFSLSLTAQNSASQTTFLKDISYKIVEKDTVKLDIHLPKQKVFDKSPVVVFIHGGAWAQGDKEIKYHYTEGIKDTLQQNGYTVVAINYRLVSKTIDIAEQLSDCKDAMRWIVDHADKYNFDTENIGLWGESAGAHLSLMIAYTAEKSNDLPKIRFVLDNFGPIDLNQVLKTNASWFTKTTYKLLLPGLYDIREKLIYAMTSFDINKNKEEAIAVARHYSPIELLENAPKTPILILHGTRDFIVPFKQSKKLHKELNKLAVTNKLIKVKKGNHGFTKTNKKEIHDLIKETFVFVQQHYYKPTFN
ncbi:alpha/beta hydrolase [Paenimyroides viscosum]|uniref:Alpha/beta hydrolase n=1 Tax=Paenimyroides viscosum TaxID=2488729 RepID=A0A3P1AK44_9FLAO|nr:alpha/beta hydrolase [Paenimyroides viscosum]RRA89314.1 alpha/beta hydrolase [Paenimyroides viscosum]